MKGIGMVTRILRTRSAIRLLLVLSIVACAAMDAQHGNAASCLTQAQMTQVQRDELASTARTLVGQIQTSNMQALRGEVIPSLAENFGGIAGSVSHLQPLVQGSAITVDELYLLDAQNDAEGTTATNAGPVDFFCGSPVVAISFPALPAGMYALAMVHATGVPHPQQISLILSKTADSRWLLAGMFDKPMTEEGRDGLWYWVKARRFTQTRMNWNAWFYYRIATNLLDPLDFLSSPNLEKLRREADQIRPTDLPGKTAMTFYAQGQLMTVNGIDTSTELGGLDLDVHYTPDAAQAAQLRDPIAARGQVTAVMAALLKMHPELQEAFHGIWVHADQGTSTLFALELPMDQIASAPSAPALSSYTVSP